MLATSWFILQGIGTTVGIAFCSFFLAIIIGTVLSILRYINIATMVINIFISLIRGTPLILQLALIYFCTPSITGVQISVIAAAILAFTINSSAYIAEIVRSGINSIPIGQFEAGKSLHIPMLYIWKDIILPQIFIIIMPALINEMVSLLKETALIGTIGGLDIMRRAQIIAAEQFTYFAPLLIAALYYYILVLLIEKLAVIYQEKYNIFLNR